MPDKNHPLPSHNFRIQKLKSLLAIVENSINGGDNHLFRNLYAVENGKEIDILENGQNSCAAFVSWILLALELIRHPHATVYGTEKDLLASGWFEIEKNKSGAAIIWEKSQASEHGLFGDKNIELRHIGFCVGEDEAISNDSKKSGFPRRHHITYGANPDGTPVRKIEKIYWHQELND